ncbi:N-acetylglucosaminyl-phosphatidylinositol de-N-acetylase [Penicillium argentinense]|uniref:N-acetylglucosaminylphosphatidylinositol deacetylase n=1 Tax=Penicillium argentinense TaxID=1131581 RepID=A0A9W9KB04_9EURO|nr:N-acetylglucosaminyl-phosphatidylinositol de-N-acetylase [Penicillium argentinense]KAJ5098552.1 N-acetylglucosaminyl-phosphatidylinositol de-N-acetylase [Penicillium argentinense]
MSFSSFNWTALAVAVAAVAIFWTLSSTTSSPFTSSFPRLQNKRICLLIAHPDDEAMFFAPSVLALTKPELGNHLKVLCFSTGDADGLGETRKEELKKSALQLGVRDENDVFIVDDPARFPDSMTANWPEKDVTSLLASAFAPDLAATLNGTAKKDPKKAPTATIDILLTFDRHGVSNHPNHRSLYHGAVNFLRVLMKDKEGFASPVTLYTLTSLSIFRKYAGVLDAPVTMLQGVWGDFLSGLRGKRKDGSDAEPRRLLFVSSIQEWMTAQSAMVKGHQSQMVWFRWGWITIGRYMTVNDLQREKV